MGFASVFWLVVLVTSYLSWLLTTVDLEWSNVTINLIASSRHPTIISPSSLFLSRALFATIIWSSIVYIVLDPIGLEFTILQADGSKRIHLFKGFARLTMFTVWSWILQGIYFTIAAICSFSVLNKGQFPQLFFFAERYLTQATWVTFEISFPVAYLVSAVVTYVLIPVTKREGLPLRTFYLPMALLMHNANVLFMAWEFFINKLSFSPYHCLFMLYYGIAYVVFSWIWYAYRKIFFYFFLDYQRKYAVIWYLALLLLITVLFFAGYYLSILQFQGKSFLANSLVALLTILSMKVFK